jgi:hypothetical protein
MIVSWDGGGKVKWIFDYFSFLFTVLTPSFDKEDAEISDWLVYIFFHIPIAFCVYGFPIIIVIILITRIVNES